MARRPADFALLGALVLPLLFGVSVGCAGEQVEGPGAGREALMRAARVADVAGEGRRAAALYSQALEGQAPAPELAVLTMHVASLYEAEGEAALARAHWERIARGYAGVPEVGGLYVQALSHLAALARAEGRRGEARRLEAEAVAAYGARALPPGSSGARAAAQARCAQLDERMEDLRYLPIAGADLDQTITLLEAVHQEMEALVQDYMALNDYESTLWAVTAECRAGEVYEIVARNLRELPLTLGGTDYPKLKALFAQLATRLDARALGHFQRAVQYAEVLALPADTLGRAYQLIDEGAWDHTPHLQEPMSAYRWRHPQSKRTGPSAPESPKDAQ